MKRTCRDCGAEPVYLVGRCRACHNTYRRAYMATVKDRERDARKRRTEEIAATVGDTRRPCNKCGESFRLTPAQAASRVRRCPRCRKMGSVNTSNKWSKADVKRRRARHALRNAIQAGKIQRQPCSRCASPNAQGHHRDYEQPLEVDWLCQKCHGLEHFPPAEIR